MSDSNSFHSFSGVDIHAVFGDVEFGEIQMVSYKADRVKAPVYVMGSSDPRTIARGKRLITGAVVFVVFEKDSLLRVMNKRNDKPHLSNQETANYNESNDNASPAGGSASGFDGSVGGGGTNTSGNLGTNFNLGASFDGTSLVKESQARLADQLLPFDITLVGANEYGKVTKMVIQGVELMSESGGISIDDLVIEKQISFIARNLKTWNNKRADTAGA